MERLEMAEKIAERANITVEEAKEVLERNNWDMLDAMIELEREGKIPGGARASTQKEEPEYVTVVPTASGREEQKARRALRRQKIKEKLRNALRVVMDNKFVVTGKDGEILRLPVLVLLICALVNVLVTVIVLVAGMAFGLRYTIEGKELGTQTVNDSMMKASEYTQHIVNDISGKAADTHSEEDQN